MTQLSHFSEQERKEALHRFQQIQPFLEGACSLKTVAEKQ
jgi:hypothetical protein